MCKSGIKPIEFAPYFRAIWDIHCRDKPMMQKAFELRFQVYCLECGFLSHKEYPEGRETDIYDEDSAHFFSLNANQELVGYVRLVPPSDGGQFPWQQQTRHLEAESSLPPPSESSEISRLMVRREYRRRRGDLVSGGNDPSEQSVRLSAGERRAESPQVLMSLYRQMYQYSNLNGIRYWYAAMERPLMRSLLRMSFNFRQVGPEIDYFGPVAPYLLDLRQMEADVGRRNPSLLAWLQRPDVTNS